MEEIKGLAFDSIFYREDNGYRVIRVEPDGGGRHFTACGNMGPIDIGEHLILHGEWVNHPKFGQQFSVESFKTEAPNTLDALQRYLGSGMIPGVGEAFAKKVIDYFGEETLEVLNSTPERLREVKGLGKKKCDDIKSFWQKKETSRELLLFLGEHGIGFNLGLKIQKSYGDQAIQKIKENPYAIIQDLKGFGFLTADRMALRMGTHAESEERVKSCISYTLQKSLEEGHCYLERESLLNLVQEHLHIDMGMILKVLNQLIRDTELIQIDQAIQLKEIYLLEEKVAQQVIRRSSRQPLVPFNSRHLSTSLPVEQELSSDQLDALNVVLRSNLSILTGGPGVGKTTLTKVIVQYLEKQGFAPILTAPTGRAAQRLEEATSRQASTIHRLLKFKGDEGVFVHDADYPLKGSVFLVDEVSMVDIHLFFALLSAIPQRAQIILIGDKDQLPSVGPGRVLADLLKTEKLSVAILKSVFRQSKNSLLVHNSHRIIEQQMPDEGDKGLMKDYYWIESETVEHTILMIDRLLKERIPEKFGKSMLEQTQVLSPMKKGMLGTVALNQHLQQVLNPYGEALSRTRGEFRMGDRVIQLVNNYEAELFNGDLGTVIGIEDEGLRVKFLDKEVIYPSDTLSDLALSYACTVHKSQGSEYPIVIMPIYEGHRMMLSLELMYTALTRAKKMAIWIGKRSILQSILEHPPTYMRNTLLASKIINTE